MKLPDQFLNWRMVNNRKVPCRHNGTMCDAHDPANWTSENVARTSPHGVAFVLDENDPWFFLDMDNCAVNGAWTPEASAIFQSFKGAWGEISQSGKGLHIMGKCDPSRLTDRRNKWDGWLEFYTSKRFIAFGDTGWQPIGGTYADKDWTEQLLKLVPQREFLGDIPKGMDPSYTGPQDDNELIAMMLKSSSTASKFGQGVTVSDLWEARAEPLSQKFPAFDGSGGFDHSSADAALMSHLAFWTGKDMPRMDRLFRRSALMRDKYLKREDYRQDTIQKAVRLCKRVYDVKQSKEVYLTVPEMIEHFRGCVYIRDNHRVMVPDGSLLKPEQFNATYGGHLFEMMPDGTKPSRKAFEAFTECAIHRFPRAISTTFKPNEPKGIITGEKVNIYVEPDIKCEPGDISQFNTFMRKLIPDDNDRKILLSFAAAMIQYPGVKFQWAPVLQGVEGNGKTLLASCIAYAVGQQYSHQPRSSQLSEKYNGFLENKLFIIVEEIHMRGRRDILDDLKAVITNQWIELRAMNQDKRMIENVANWFFCTNYKDAIIKSRNDRRYCIFYTGQQEKGDLARDGMNGRYFPNLYEWLREGGGYSHVAHYLKNMSIEDRYNPATLCHRAPKTSSTDEAIETSTGGVEAEIIEAVDSETVGFRGGWVSTWALDKLLKEKQLRLSRSKISQILNDLGYFKIGRSPNLILREEGKRPILWNKDENSDVNNYKLKQGKGYE